MPTVLITGANRGLGLEFATQYRDEGWQVLAVARRDSDALNALCGSANVNRLTADIAKAGDRRSLVEAIGSQPIDVLLNNAGVFGPKPMADGDQRQSFGHLDVEVWEQLLRTNLIAPGLLTEALVDNVAASDQRKVTFISSVMGSTAEGEGGILAYRTSKSALNNLAANLAHDLVDQQIAVLSLCPGWVQTDMGGPQASVTPGDSIRGMRQLISELTPQNTGRFVRYNGDPLNW